MTQAEYARHSGLTHGRVSQLVKKGMPLTTFEEADRWRGMSATQRTKERPDAPKVQPPADPTNGLDGVQAAFDRQQEIERFAYQMAVKAIAEDLPDAERKVSIHAKAAANLVAQKGAVEASLKQSGRLVEVSWVKKVIDEHDGAIASLVRSMPRVLAARINPADPVAAEMELRRWVEENFLATLHGTNPWAEKQKT